VRNGDQRVFESGTHFGFAGAEAAVTFSGSNRQARGSGSADKRPLDCSGSDLSDDYAQRQRRDADAEGVARSASFAEASAKIPGYPAAYNYDKFAHVRVARLPLDGLRLRGFSTARPLWEEQADWSLLLSGSLFVLTAAMFASLCCAAPFVPGLVCDQRLKISRFHLRLHLARAGAALFTTPEIK
jgi:hypothetical protein